MRVAELVVRMVAAETGRPYVSVRFGNVLGSRGSPVLRARRSDPVVPAPDSGGRPGLHRACRSVTVTDPAMERFFMTIPEAVQLVLQASTLGRNGEVFVLDMGEPVKIVDLARDVIELSGLRVDRDIEIVYTGLRPGERLYEILFTGEETTARTEHEKIFVARNGAVPAMGDLKREIDALVALAEAGQTAQLHQKLAALANNKPTPTPVVASHAASEAWQAAKQSPS